MSNAIKNQKSILAKLNIDALNPMQEEAKLAFHSSKEIVLLSPTGSGKTLAFLLPMIENLDKDKDEVQALILVPSRELAIQIEQVAREMGTGYKINAVYGGHSFSKNKMDIKHRPALLIGTPGRVADHLRRNTFSTDYITTLVLDEFDKSLEIGFESEMKEIMEHLPNISKKILTSATQEVDVPKFVGLNAPICINYLGDDSSKLKLRIVTSPIKDKLETLFATLCHLGNQPGILFCNFKESIQRVSDFLESKGIEHGCFYGGMEQIDRERALIQFRNGSHQLLLATDLAARGIDIPEITFIIHFHLPLRAHEFTHRNGRTARMHRDGTAYILKWEEENLPEYILPESYREEFIDKSQLSLPSSSPWTTVFVSGGRKDKISKGDIAGLFLQKGGLETDQLGVIELKQDCAFVAVLKSKATDLIANVDNQKLKNKKVKINLLLR